jgi:hypothetical protein
LTCGMYDFNHSLLVVSSWEQYTRQCLPHSFSTDKPVHSPRIEWTEPLYLLTWLLSELLQALNNVTSWPPWYAGIHVFCFLKILIALLCITFQLILAGSWLRYLLIHLLRPFGRFFSILLLFAAPHAPLHAPYVPLHRTTFLIYSLGEGPLAFSCWCCVC